MTSAKPKPPLVPGETRAYPVLPLRDIVVFPAHDRAALRRPRKVDQGARRGDALRHVHSARDAEERLRRRSGDRRDLRDRHARERPATAQAARRHRQGAGRGRRARAGQALHRPRRILRGRRRRARRQFGRAGRSRGAGALGGQRVRELREAQQEGVAGSRRRRSADRRLRQARRHRRVASRRQDSRQAGHPGDAHRSPSGWRRCSA